LSGSESVEVFFITYICLKLFVNGDPILRGEGLGVWGVRSGISVALNDRSKKTLSIKKTSKLY